MAADGPSLPAFRLSRCRVEVGGLIGGPRIWVCQEAGGACGPVGRAEGVAADWSSPGRLGSGLGANDPGLAAIGRD